MPDNPYRESGEKEALQTQVSRYRGMLRDIEDSLSSIAATHNVGYLYVLINNINEELASPAAEDAPQYWKKYQKSYQKLKQTNESLEQMLQASERQCSLINAQLVKMKKMYTRALVLATVFGLWLFFLVVLVLVP